MDKKNFIYLVLLCSGLMAGAFYSSIYFFYKMPDSTLWIYNSMARKESYARSIIENKIVITGGSSALFSVNAEQIGNELKVPAVNMAVHAGMTTSYILYKAKEALNQGDTIVVILEYENLNWDGQEAKARRDYILTHDRTYLQKMTLQEKISLVLSVRAPDIVSSISQQQGFVSKMKIGAGYTSDTLNKKGDETHKDGNKKIIFNTMYPPFRLDRFKETFGLNELKKFSRWCNNNRVNLIIGYPYTINKKDYHNEKYKRYFKELDDYFRKNRIDTVGSPHESLYPIEMFYDTNYHLNMNGSKVATKRLIGHLRLKLNGINKSVAK